MEDKVEELTRVIESLSNALYWAKKLGVGDTTNIFTNLIVKIFHTRNDAAYLLSKELGETEGPKNETI